MVWGCISASGVGKMVFIHNKMDKHPYLNILKNNLHDSIVKLGLDAKGFLFQQDNDPKHSFYLVQEWLIYHCKQLPPQLPDLNPIEHVRELLERKIRKHKITSKASLKTALSVEWEKIAANKTKVPKNQLLKLKAARKSTEY